MPIGHEISIAKAPEGVELKVGAEVHVIDDDECLDLGLRMIAEALEHRHQALDLVGVEAYVDAERLDEDGRPKSFYAKVPGLGSVHFVFSEFALAQLWLSTLQPAGRA